MAVYNRTTQVDPAADAKL